MDTAESDENRKRTVVILTGSPRMKGNCSIMADAFIEAAEARGLKVVRFDTAFMDTHGCRHCDRCYSRDTPCVFSDGFNELADEVERCDGVVFCAPVYWFGMPSHIKTIIDRFYAFIHGNRDVKGKRCALITCANEPEMGVFEGIRIQYEMTADYLDWTDVGKVMVPGMVKPGDVRDTDGVRQAAELAEMF